MKTQASVLAFLVVLGVGTACDGASKPTPDATAAAKADAKADTPDTKTDSAKTPQAEAPSPAGAEDWLVWFDNGDGVRTRWYTAAADGADPVVAAERKALVVANDAEMWLIKRKDVRVEVQDCMCLDVEEGSPMCSTTGHVVRPGLVAEPMSKGKTVVLEEASPEATMGEVFELSLSLRGGVGTQLFAEVGDSGFYCGAHPMYESGYPVFDPTASKPASLPKIDLPREMKKDAATGEMFDNYRECQEDLAQSLDGFVDEALELSDVSVALKGGSIALTWGFVADVTYVCSVDYLIHGRAKSGLLPAGKALGLADPLAPSLVAAFGHVGDAKVLGWSKVSRDPAGRTAALAWFNGVDETPWPAASLAEVEVEVEAQAGAEPAKAVTDPALAKRELARGRKLTRAGEYAEAVGAFDAAIAADASLARAWAARGYARLLDHKLDAAVADCEQALKLGGSDRFRAAVFFNLGEVEVARHDVGAARAAFTSSLALRENKEVRAALEAL